MRTAPALIIVSALLACQRGQTLSTRPGTVVATRGAAEDTATIRAANARTVAEVLRTIAGHESEPAGSVFTDVRFLAGVPARRFLGIMSVGYANALGVRCEHCHDLSNFSSEAKRPKRAAREMQAMHKGVNTQLIAMENLDTQPPEDRTINCNTCHQGRINPNKP